MSKSRTANSFEKTSHGFSYACRVVPLGRTHDASCGGDIAAADRARRSSHSSQLPQLFSRGLHETPRAISFVLMRVDNLTYAGRSLKKRSREILLSSEPHSLTGLQSTRSNAVANCLSQRYFTAQSHAASSSMQDDIVLDSSAWVRRSPFCLPEIALA